MAVLAAISVVLTKGETNVALADKHALSICRYK